MKKNMKRLLSLVIATLLVVASVPAVFAAEPAINKTTALLVSHPAGTNETLNHTVVSGEQIGGFTFLAAKAPRSPIVKKTSSSYMQANNFATVENSWIALMFDGTDMGREMKISFQFGTTGNMNIYIVPYSESVTYDNTTFSGLTTADSSYVGTILSTNKTAVLDVSLETEGKQVLVLQSAEVKTGNFQFYRATIQHHAHEFTDYVYDEGSATYWRDGTETAVCNDPNCNGTHTRTKEGTILQRPVVADFVAGGQTIEVTSLYDFAGEAVANGYTGTLSMKTDAEESVCWIPAGITLDLKGHKLSAQFVICDGTITDSVGGGVLKTPRGGAVLKTAPSVLTTWDAYNGGYTFHNGISLASTILQNNTFTFRPEFGAIANMLMADGAADNGITIRVQVSYKNKAGVVRTMDFDYADDFVKQVYGQNKAFTLTLTNTASFTDLSYTVMIVSETQAVLAGSAVK